ncbi:MAG: hypothetical protein AAF560_32290, partial [Acidobacteriota bacterium]
SRELKKVQRQATKAMAAGEIDKASALYQQILDGVPAGDPRRSDALYLLGMQLLDPASASPNLNQGVSYLEELTASSPAHPRQLEVSIVQALLSQAKQAASRHEACTTELDAARAELESERQAAEASLEEIADESKAADGRVKSLQAQLRKARAELAETQSELEKKEEALEKLKEALVGRAGVSGS